MTSNNFPETISEEEDETVEILEKNSGGHGSALRGGAGSALRSKAGSPGMLSKKSDQDVKRSIKSKMNLSGMQLNNDSNLAGVISARKNSQRPSALH